MPNKTIKIIFFGDIVGSLGRTAVKEIVPVWQKKYQPDLMIANIENLAHGKGITLRTLQDISQTGIPLFTGGNHIWAKEQIEDIDSAEKFPIAFPANDSRTPKKYLSQSVEIDGQKITVINLNGRTFMLDDTLSNPFLAADKFVKKHKDDIIIVDFHAEATSEKRALGLYLDGKVSAVLGTHTHVPTNDAQILKSGTGYITDVGMIGAYPSVIGVDSQVIIDKFVTEQQIRHQYPDSGQIELNAVLLEIDRDSKKTIAIQNLREILH
jgi:polar amino acid transport system substrate-binding protein